LSTLTSPFFYGYQYFHPGRILGRIASYIFHLIFYYNYSFKIIFPPFPRIENPAVDTRTFFPPPIDIFSFPHVRKLTGPWKKTFRIPKCRKSLPVHGIRHFTFLHARKSWPLEGALAWLQGAEFPAWGNLKGRIPGTERFFRHSGMQKSSIQGLKSPEDFSGMGAGKRQQ
jgi:hypothetical protein